MGEDHFNFHDWVTFNFALQQKAKYETHQPMGWDMSAYDANHTLSQTDRQI
jgi:hypothetical protein